MEVYVLCEMLIDQNRYIGPDPVGHRCMNRAEFEDAQGYLYCSLCKDIIGSGRLTLPIGPHGKDHQLRMMKTLTQKMVLSET